MDISLTISVTVNVADEDALHEVAWRLVSGPHAVDGKDAFADQATQSTRACLGHLFGLRALDALSLAVNDVPGLSVVGASASAG